MTVSIDDRGPAPPCPFHFNLAGYVLEAGRRCPSKDALVRFGGPSEERWSHGRLRRAVLGLAGYLAEQGIPPGARVLIRLGNAPAFPIAFLAAAAADLVPVVVSSLLTAREIERVADHVAPALVIGDPTLPLCSFGCRLVMPDALDAAMDSELLAPVPGDPDRPGYIVFTSGTAAEPRAVVHAHRAVWARRMMWQGWYGLTPGDRMLHAGAFNWTFTLGTGLLDPWTVGATAAVPIDGFPPERLARAITETGATLFAAAPGFYRRLLDATDRIEAPALRHGLSAGEKLTDRLRARWRIATDRPVHEAFGMSECSTFVSSSPHDPAKPGTLGRAQPGRTVAVLSEDGVPIKAGNMGLLAVSADDPGLMLGYLGPDRATELPTTNGWFVTGDMAAMARDGTLRYGGRSDDMLNAGGVRVSPAEVEAALLEHPEIEDCAVTEVPIKPDVMAIAAFYVAASDLDPAELAAHMSERAARYKTPKLYLRYDALPRNAHGKLKRRALRDAWEADNEQARHPV